MKCFLRYVGDPGFQVTFNFCENESAFIHCLIHPQVGVGEDLGVHQTTVCKTIWSVCKAIVDKSAEWIHFPNTAVEMEQEKKSWQRKYRFPSAIGAIDCTHILIKRPGNYKDEFVNRKGLNSFNVQATCNATEQFTSVDCEWAGSVHDARIWRNSDIFDIIQDNASGALLLTDEAYPLTPWMMKPYRDPVTSSQKMLNVIHTRERVIIERVFGQVKQRFPILQSKVRVKTEKNPRMIAACFILHNAAKYLNDRDFELDETTTYDIAVPASTVIENTALQRGQKRRDAIASYLLGDHVC
ncbi:putative nuclease HARBI1 [Ochlerotatus camptorhynchus]|uniref:putative nuclease HARBI1 n=1 Tax=Ochlerotatus camptorhynchus TaxID=644619 RepID=UPI0031DDCD25